MRRTTRWDNYLAMLRYLILIILFASPAALSDPMETALRGLDPLFVENPECTGKLQEMIALERAVKRGFVLNVASLYDGEGQALTGVIADSSRLSLGKVARRLFAFAVGYFDEGSSIDLTQEKLLEQNCERALKAGRGILFKTPLSDIALEKVSVSLDGQIVYFVRVTRRTQELSKDALMNLASLLSRDLP